MIASTHASPWMTVPPALLLAAAMLFYWFRLGRTAAPGRRRVRRWSLVCGLLALPGLVRGVSFLDPEIDSIDYVVTWSAAMVLVLVLFLLAFLDAAVTIQAHGKKYEREMTRAGHDLVRAIERRRDEGGRTDDEDGRDDDEGGGDGADPPSRPGVDR